MSIPIHLVPLIAVVTIASVTSVLLLPVLAAQLLSGRLARAARSTALAAVLDVIAYAAAVPLGASEWVAVPTP
ncbi:hypothetical protein MRBLMI12_001751 [Microbacterium sp. LMI12-1-1.1]|uniref:hypothetical protein n=1 Tax=Microbacterium sp. LMI12-1-1.1 TaxID=3135225 RepID=UPI00342352C1